MNPKSSNTLAARAQLLVAMGALLLCAIVAVRRGESAWRAAGESPGTAITSGCEEETIFSLWRAMHSQTVYLDSTRLPFATAYFNWLFYAAYAAPLRAVAPARGGEAIPRISRLLTAVFALAGASALFVLLRQVMAQDVLAAAIACFVFFGPLAGWWAHTARPDIGALAFEAAGVVSLLLWWRTHPARAVIGALAFFFAAWSFKQTYVVGLASTLLFLALQRQWRLAILLGGGMTLLWVGTFVLLGPAYRAAQSQVASNNIYHLAGGWNSLRDAFLKTSPLWLLFAAALASPKAVSPESHPVLARDARRFAVIGLSVALPVLFVAACKQGASSYYFFPVALLLGVASAASVALSSSRWAGVLGCVAMAGLQLAVISGVAGRITIDQQCKALNAIWQTFREMPEPRFAADNRLNLPWLNPHSPPLVLAYNYEFHHLAGVHLEAGGVGGLIEAGYFSSLLLPVAVEESFLGGRLSRYHRGSTVGAMTVYRRSDLSAPAITNSSAAPIREN